MTFVPVPCVRARAVHAVYMYHVVHVFVRVRMRVHFEVAFSVTLVDGDKPQCRSATKCCVVRKIAREVTGLHVQVPHALIFHPKQ